MMMIGEEGSAKSVAELVITKVAHSQSCSYHQLEGNGSGLYKSAIGLNETA